MIYQFNDDKSGSKEKIKVLFLFSCCAFFYLFSDVFGVTSLILVCFIFSSYLFFKFFLSHLFLDKLISFLFLFSIMLFYFPAFFSISNPSGIYESYKFSYEIVTAKNVGKIVFYVAFGLFSFYFGYASRLIRVKRDLGVSYAKTNIAFIFFIFSFVCIFFLRMQQISIFENRDFSDLYTEGVGGNFFLKLVGYFYYAFVPVIYFVTKSKVRRNFILFSIFLESVLHAMLGQRVWIFFGVLSICYLYYFENRTFLSKKPFFLFLKLCFSFLIVALLMQLGLYYREDLNLAVIFSDWMFLINFLLGQTGTFTGFSIAIDNYNFVFSSNIWPIFDPLNIFRNPLQNEFSDGVSNIGSRLTYLSCSACFYEGRSYGSSAFIQLYQFGILGVGGGFFCIGFLAKEMVYGTFGRVFKFIFFFFFLKTILFMPRGDFFPHYLTVATILLSFFIAFLLGFFCKRSEVNGVK